MQFVIKLVFFLLLLAGPAFADETPAYLELACRVVDERGQPVGGVPVRLCGRDRGALDFDDDYQPEQKRAWNFTTDQEGRFIARFGRFQAFSHQQVTGLNEPGYGEFHLVAFQAGYAGGVSREILNLDEEGSANYQQHANDPDTSAQENEEWTRGEFASRLLGDPTENQPLVIVLKRGLTLHGCMLDTAGRPVRGETVNLCLDLHKHSHTGAGGEIFEQQTTTDQAGEFRFRHVYPNVFTIGAYIVSPNPPDWIRTRLRGHWMDGELGQITPRRGNARHLSDYERSIDVRAVFARRALHRYFGRVTDANGHPLPRAKVVVHWLLEKPAPDTRKVYGPEQTTLTDGGGNYSVRVGSSLVDGIWVSPGNDTDGQGVGDGTLMVPGHHDLVLRPKETGE